MTIFVKKNWNQDQASANTNANPLKNRKIRNIQKYWTNEDTMPTMPSINNVAINTIFLPFVSARHPHIYEPITIPVRVYFNL